MTQPNLIDVGETIVAQAGKVVRDIPPLDKWEFWACGRYGWRRLVDPRGRPAPIFSTEDDAMQWRLRTSDNHNYEATIVRLVNIKG